VFRTGNRRKESPGVVRQRRLVGMHHQGRY
jgi:hypothetical protein